MRGGGYFVNRKCVICKNRIQKYEPISDYFLTMGEKYGYKPGPSETCNKIEYLCPVCHSSDRDRLCVAFLERLFKNKIFVQNKIKLLHIAPAEPINKVIKERFQFIDLKNMDLYMKNMDYVLDIQDMNEIPNGYFDLWICFHVLEHVKSDKEALEELNRILSKNGIGILLVPLDLKQRETDEEWGLSEEENWRRFGQGDHVRKYEKSDFLKRVGAAGFNIYELNRSFFGRKIFKENAFTNTSTLYIVCKRGRKLRINKLLKDFTEYYNGQ